MIAANCAHSACASLDSVPAVERLSFSMSQDSPSSATSSIPAAVSATANHTVMNILLMLSTAHMLNDTFQAMLPAIYPLLKDSYHLTFTQIGLITLTYQLTGSLLQPVVGFYTDRKPKPYSLPIGMGATLCGMALLSQAHTFELMCLAAGLMGLGSSIFHPESSRVARLASGGRHGFAQSLFQVGGNFGTSMGPLLAAYIVVPFGQRSIAWFSIVALTAMTILFHVGTWYRQHIVGKMKSAATAVRTAVPGRRVKIALTILMLLVFSKNVYLASLTSFYTFYLIHKFNL